MQFFLQSYVGQIMKKLVEVFCKNKSNSYNVCKDVRLESSKNVSSEEMSNSNSYKSFQFDTNCLAICENKLCCTGNSGHEIKFLKKNTQPLIALPTSPQVLTDCKSLTLDNSYEIIKDLLTSETKEKREKSAINSHLENLKKSTWLNTAGTLIKVQNQPKRDVNPQLNKMQKKNNVYVINVTNSKDFHIGSQTTVNVHKLENFKHVENKITDFSTEWEELLDSEEVSNFINWL